MREEKKEGGGGVERKKEGGRWVVLKKEGDREVGGFKRREEGGWS